MPGSLKIMAIIVLDIGIKLKSKPRTKVLEAGNAKNIDWTKVDIMTIPCMHVVPSMYQAPVKQIPRTYQASTKHLSSICQVVGNHLTSTYQSSVKQVTSICQVSNTDDKQKPISWVSLFLNVSPLASNNSPAILR